MATDQYSSETESKKLKRSRHLPDRFSDLPDHILNQILSFLDIKLAAQTSVLSTRWKDTWKDVSTLHLSTTPLGPTWQTFVPNVYKILDSLRSHHHDSSRPNNAVITRINFEIHEDPYAGLLFVDDVFDYVMEYAATSSRGLYDLSITRPSNAATTVQLSRLTDRVVAHRHDRSLETLMLEEGFLLVGSDAIASCGFRLLTALELKRCVFGRENNRHGDEYDYVRPFEGLPCLKRLKLIDCSSVVPVVVSGAELVDLEIRCRRSSSRNNVRLVEVTAPKLRSFVFSGDLTDVEHVEHFSLPSLERANVRLVWIEPGQDYIERVEELNRAFENFLLGLRNAKSLDLCFAKSESLRRRKVLNCPVIVTKLLMVYDENSPFTRLKTLRIRYPRESPDDVNDDRVISYHFEGSRGIEEDIC